MTLHVLLITRNLPPLVGGMERLVLEAALGLNEKYRLSVIGPKGCGRYLPDEVEVYEVSPGILRFVLGALAIVLRLARKGSFDCVVGGSGIVAPHVVIAQFLTKSPSVIFVHGLDLIVDSWAYQLLFIPFVRSVSRVVANSRNTFRLAVSKRVQEQRLVVIHPGADIAKTDKADAEKWLLSSLPEAAPRKILLFVGRIIPRKGLSQFVEFALTKIVQAEPNVLLIIAGDAPGDGLIRESKELKLTKAKIEEYGLKNNVLFLGSVDDPTLDKCYWIADCMVFPLVPTHGDVEGFGIVAVEAAAHGTPTVAFDEGGVSDAVCNGKSGYVVPSGKYDELTSNILSVLNSSRAMQQSCLEHAKQFSWKKFQDNVVRIVESECNN